MKILKNQTKKKSFTIVVYLNTEYGKEEVDVRTVEAENAREAVRLAFKNIFQ
ncbi:MAG: hypothetical protein J6S14_19860 [Clostridia bacterium]|nr:hypothetical protein [Clostridia bacterium]